MSVALPYTPSPLRVAQGRAVLRTVDISNLTVFGSARLRLSRRLNVIIGENGTGKTHLLKAIYSVLSACADESPRHAQPTKAFLQGTIADKLVNVFKPEALGRLAKRRQGQARCDMSFQFGTAEDNVSFSFATNSKTDVTISTLPSRWLPDRSTYLPTRDLLTIFPNFVSVYDAHYFDFEETWRDTCVLLGAPLKRGPQEARVRELVQPLEQAMSGPIVLDRNGRFYLQTGSGKLEMPLVAEGIRKLAMVARLIATGALLERGYLFWDEPEASMNPRLVRALARTIVDVSRSGIQVFIATHSLFLLREMEIILADGENRRLQPRFFGLHMEDGGDVSIQSGASITSIGEITSLNEEIHQTDRFMDIDFHR